MTDPAGARRPTVVRQAVLVTVATAAVATLVTGLVSLGLVSSAAEAEARRQLARQADLVAATVDRGGGAPRLARLLARQGIEVEVVPPGSTPTLPVPPAAAGALAAGEPVSTTARLDDRRLLVEGRPTGQGAVLLAQPARSATALEAAARRRLVLPLLLGLLGGALAGVLLARRLTGPLARAASGARRLAAGDRDVELPPQGPAEVVAVTEALNGLSRALATSESRQREFLLTVSHELRTPLTAVRGYAEALADGVLPPERVAEVGATLLAEAQRLDRMVSDLLDLARLGAHDLPLDLELVDLAALLDDAARVWRDRAGAVGVDLRTERPDEPLLATTDAGRVRQVLDNLAENALRVTPAGSPIVLAARRGTPGAGGSPSVVLEVRDGGPGLTDDDLLVAFDRSALHDRYRGVRPVGTGLGLALVAGLAARLGGTARAGRAPEGGAAFALVLPTAAWPAPSPTAVAVAPTADGLHAPGGHPR